MIVFFRVFIDFYFFRCVTNQAQEKQFGTQGGGFWVVAIFGSRVIWYNDIEDGFNVSAWHTFGQIDEYWCNQADLEALVTELPGCIKGGYNSIFQAGPPKNI